ncbi:MAG: hypothetical protein RMJ56_15510 [Gemmataceae bacterium]|nr:hypothetical protein [Gemmata sp.]MDW8199004.1 hypothetical protein [Gemmataceae bacterium]
MKPFVIAAVLAAVLTMSAAPVASAQWVVQSRGVTPYGAIVTNRQVYNWDRIQSYNTYVSPLGTVKKQVLYTDVWGNRWGRAAGFNPFLGVGYDKTFVQPNPLTPQPLFVAPNPRWVSPGWVSPGWGRRW